MKAQSLKIQAQREFPGGSSSGGVIFKIKSKGFTLIELLVAVAIFSIIIGAAVGVFASALKAQRRVLAQQETLGEMSYALDYMSRALRMAKKATDNTCITTNSNYETTMIPSIKFVNYQGICEEFSLDSVNHQLQESINKASPVALTSSNINVADFKVILTGEGDDKLQPAVTLFIKITSHDLTESQFQTTISQRNLDVY